MFARTWLKSRSVSAGPVPSRTRTSAPTASIASRACSRSRASGVRRWKPSDETVYSVCTSRSETWSLRSSSSSCRRNSFSPGCPGSSATDELARLDNLLGVDLLERRSVCVARQLTFSRVRGRDCQIVRDAELLRDRQRPGDQLGQRLASRPEAGLGEPLEVDQLPRESVAGRPPQGLPQGGGGETRQRPA